MDDLCASDFIPPANCIFSSQTLQATQPFLTTELELNSGLVLKLELQNPAYPKCGHHTLGGSHVHKT